MELPAKWDIFGQWSCRNGIYYISVLQDGDKPSGSNKKIELSKPEDFLQNSKYDWEMKNHADLACKVLGLISVLSLTIFRRVFPAESIAELSFSQFPFFILALLDCLIDSISSTVFTISVIL